MNPKLSLTKIFLTQAMNASLKFGQSKSPTVISCGGIYLPRKKAESQAVSYDVLNVANEKEPTKVFIKQQPFSNQLHQILFKESLN